MRILLVAFPVLLMMIGCDGGGARTVDDAATADTAPDGDETAIVDDVFSDDLSDQTDLSDQSDQLIIDDPTTDADGDVALTDGTILPDDDAVLSDELSPADEDVPPSDDDAVHTLTLSEPAEASVHTVGEPVHFAGTTDCFPATVAFVADGQWSIGSVETTGGSFAYDYTFNTTGASRTITVTATGADCTANDSVTIAIVPAQSDNPLDVPYFCQYENTLEPGSTCQNTSVAMVLSFYGWNGDPDDITTDWGKDYAQSPSGLAEVFNSYSGSLGVSLTPHTSGTFAEMKTLIDEGKPVIVHGYFTQYGHVVVTVGYDATGYFVNDPAGQWSEVYQSGYSNYCDYGYSGKSVRYAKSAFESAIGPDGTVWYHEPVTQ